MSLSTLECLKFSPEANQCLIRQSPGRWDEFLEIEARLVIELEKVPLSEVLSGLLEAGYPQGQFLWLCGSDNIRPIRPEDPLPRDWESFDHLVSRPQSQLLKDLSILLTRAPQECAPVARALESWGAQVQTIPLISFEAPQSWEVLDRGLAQLDSFDWLIFTSKRAVQSFFNRMKTKGIAPSSPPRIACVGPATASALAQRQWHPELLPQEYVAESLIEAFAQKLGQKLEGLRILLPRAQEARELIPETLKSWGAEVIIAPCYRTIPQSLSPEQKASIPGESLALFTSPSNVSRHQEESLEGKDCYAIGPVTAERAAKLGYNVLGLATPHKLEGFLSPILSARCFQDRDKL